MIKLLLISTPGVTAGWTLGVKGRLDSRGRQDDWTLRVTGWTLGKTDKLDSRGDRPAGLGPGRLGPQQARAETPRSEKPCCEACGGRARPGRSQQGRGDRSGRAARSPEAEGPPHTASPGLAHPTLADDEDLQSGQHVLVHPVPALLRPCPRARQCCPGSAKAASACAPPWSRLPLLQDVWAAEATERLVPPRSSSASAHFLEHRSFFAWLLRRGRCV